MLIVPYRVKNPWKRFPFATVSLIALNVLIYLCTTEYFLVIREHVTETYASQLGVSPILTIFSAMFLHSDILHLAGNMLFLWVFGPPVEDRLGIPRFLLVYFVTGIMGDLLQGALDTAMVGHTVPCIGASGCIMGVLGAYWYLFSWSTVCVFYWFWWFFRGVWEVRAFWVIGFFIGMDVVQGFLNGPAGGVANFAHVGGGVAGALLCLALRMKRDSAELSQAKAVQAEMKDLTLVPLADLETMRQANPQSPDIIKAMLRPAVGLGQTDLLDKAFREAGGTLIEHAPDLVAKYLFSYHGNPTIYRPTHLMRLARYLEGVQRPRQALDIYQLLCKAHPTAPEIEMALYRAACCHWEKLQDAAAARGYLEQLLQRYPFGTLEPHARRLLQQLDR